MTDLDPAHTLAELGCQLDNTVDEPRRRRSPSAHRQARTVVETSVREDCEAELNRRGKCIVKHQTMHGQRGTPDLIACVTLAACVGRMVVIECKRSDPDKPTSPTAAQLGQLRAWQNAGALAGWVRSYSDLLEILDHLDEPGWRNDFAVPGDGRSKGQPW